MPIGLPKSLVTEAKDWPNWGDQRAASVPACPNPSQRVGLPGEIKGWQVHQPALIPHKQ